MHCNLNFPRPNAQFSWHFTPGAGYFIAGRAFDSRASG